MMSAKSACQHLQTRIYRHPFANGRGAHIVELCEGCGANIRGSGRWVRRSEVIERGLDPDALPLTTSRQNAQI
jgi:hypothetical protein